jgi:hypothetical protein
MTNEMKLIADSHIFNDRIAARAAVLDNHRVAIKELAVRKYADDLRKTSPQIQSLPRKR